VLSTYAHYIDSDPLTVVIYSNDVKFSIPRPSLARDWQIVY